MARKALSHVSKSLHSRLEALLAEERIDATLQIGGHPLIAIRVSGGIGDYVVIARFLRDLAAQTEEFRFDVFCPNPSVADWVFGPLPQFNRSYNEFLFWRLNQMYALALQINQFVILQEDTARWKELAPYNSLNRVLGTIMRSRGDIEVCVDHHPFLDNHLAQKAVFMNLRRENFLHGMARIRYGGPAYPLACDLGVARKFGLPARYITINNGFDAGFVITGRVATKCYPYSDELLLLFKQRYPDVAVVQIGGCTSTPIALADFNLVERTTLKEAAGVLSGAMLHIDNEGGLVHIATCLGVRSAVIFGPTSLDYFAYPGNINLAPPVCGNCWWVNGTWMDLCPRGYGNPRCMHEHRPQAIVDAIAASWSPKARDVEKATRSITVGESEVPVRKGASMHAAQPAYAANGRVVVE
jgi:ADP-heptose:LPS heptosyltransferase